MEMEGDDGTFHYKCRPPSDTEDFLFVLCKDKGTQTQSWIRREHAVMHDHTYSKSPLAVTKPSIPSQRHGLMKALNSKSSLYKVLHDHSYSKLSISQMNDLKSLNSSHGFDNPPSLPEISINETNFRILHLDEIMKIDRQKCLHIVSWVPEMEHMSSGMVFNPEKKVFQLTFYGKIDGDPFFEIFHHKLCIMQENFKSQDAPTTLFCPRYAVFLIIPQKGLHGICYCVPQSLETDIDDDRVQTAGNYFRRFAELNSENGFLGLFVSKFQPIVRLSKLHEQKQRCKQKKRKHFDNGDFPTPDLRVCAEAVTPTTPDDSYVFLNNNVSVISRPSVLPCSSFDDTTFRGTSQVSGTKALMSYFQSNPYQETDLKSSSESSCIEVNDTVGTVNYTNKGQSSLSINRNVKLGCDFKDAQNWDILESKTSRDYRCADNCMNMFSSDPKKHKLCEYIIWIKDVPYFCFEVPSRNHGSSETFMFDVEFLRQEVSRMMAVIEPSESPSQIQVKYGQTFIDVSTSTNVKRIKKEDGYGETHLENESLDEEKILVGLKRKIQRLSYIDIDLANLFTPTFIKRKDYTIRLFQDYDQALMVKILYERRRQRKLRRYKEKTFSLIVKTL